MCTRDVYESVHDAMNMPIFSITDNETVSNLNNGIVF